MKILVSLPDRVANMLTTLVVPGNCFNPSDPYFLQLVTQILSGFGVAMENAPASSISAQVTEDQPVPQYGSCAEITVSLKETASMVALVLQKLCVNGQHKAVADSFPSIMRHAVRNQQTNLVHEILESFDGNSLDKLLECMLKKYSADAALRTLLIRVLAPLLARSQPLQYLVLSKYATIREYLDPEFAHALVELIVQADNFRVANVASGCTLPSLLWTMTSDLLCLWGDESVQVARMNEVHSLLCLFAAKI